MTNQSSFKKSRAKIKKELKDRTDLEYKKRSKTCSKSNYQSYGVRTPDVRKIAKKNWKKIKYWPKEQVLDFAEFLLKTEISELQTIAFSWAFHLKTKLRQDDYNRFYNWLINYVDTWFKCDDFCTHAFGYLIYKYPRLSNSLLDWTKHENRWVRRAAAVSLIFSFRRGEQLELALKIAQELLIDQEDMVQKGYGWMLKEASNKWP
ncbi:MAG: DNA alkylation repair protein, partial [Patescibacteria group bacterium]|nr:DNA alkylation repair protein [Patescibacteria group bacterium]